MKRLRNFKWKDSTVKAISLCFLFLSTQVASYEGDIHQRLTFMAAKQLSLCDRASGDGVMSALDTRYIVRANVAQAESNVFVRMFRWNYYNRDEGREKAALGIIDTRFHAHFNSLASDLAKLYKSEERYKTLGKLLNYIQDVTSPSKVVPVFTNRWWRLSFYDRFDRFPIDVTWMEKSLIESCAEIQNFAQSSVGKPIEQIFQSILQETAEKTIEKVREPIAGLPADWTYFWAFGETDEFGNYGPAGNKFGERTAFDCGANQKCLLLDKDPIYRDFANQLHFNSIVATMKSIRILQGVGIAAPYVAAN